MPTPHVTPRFGLGAPVRWTGEPGRTLHVITVVLELRPGPHVVVTYGLHDPVHPRPKVLWATDAELEAADAEEEPHG